MEFIHTADWHIGNSFSNFSKKQREELNRARFTAIKSTFIYADKNNIPLIISSGDQIDNGEILDVSILRELFNIIADYPNIKVIMIAGNHDALSPMNVYSRLEKNFYPDNLILTEGNETIEFKELNCKIFASSLKSKNGTDNPLNWIDNKKEDMIRIGVAHGSLKIPGRYKPEDFPIELDFAKSKNLDYLALGHYHSFYKQDEYTYYSGTPEPLQAKDKGYILKVSIEKGKIPKVENIPVYKFEWLKDTIEINSNQDFELFIEKFKKGASMQKIYNINLHGNLSITDFNRVNNNIAELEDKYFDFKVNNNLTLRPTDEELYNIVPEGYMRNVVTRLISGEIGSLELPEDNFITKEAIINRSLLKIFEHFRI